jgi:hypothetical protein
MFKYELCNWRRLPLDLKESESKKGKHTERKVRALEEKKEEISRDTD